MQTSGSTLIRDELEERAMEWHHYAIAWDKESGRVDFYLDGVQHGEPIFESLYAANDFLQSNALLALGSLCKRDLTLPEPSYITEFDYGECHFDETGRHNFAGEIDDLGLFGGALTASQIAERWNVSLTERILADLEPNLVLFFDFDDADIDDDRNIECTHSYKGFNERRRKTCKKN